MISFENVTKTFGDGSVGLVDFSLEVAPGECVFVTGPSGSGKTTLMRLLTQEYAPTSGSIIVNDLDLSRVKRRHRYKLRRSIGVIYQDYRLIKTKNVWENIALPLYISGMRSKDISQRVSQLLKLVDLEDQALNFPLQLSGGEAQRVAIARALTTNPEIICADEPTGNLDPETSLKISELLLKLAKEGVTILFITHNQEVIKKYAKTRIVRIEDGKLVSDSNPTKKQASSKAKSKVEEPEDTQLSEEDLDEDEADSKTTKVIAEVESLDDDEPQSSSKNKKKSSSKDSKKKSSSKSSKKEDKKSKKKTKKVKITKV